MPCDTKPSLTKEERQAQANALELLARKLKVGGGASVVIGANGSIAFRGWEGEERGGLSDLCAYRKLLATGSPELRTAVARAEAMSGRRIDGRAIAAGVHSHDGGKTWGSH